MVVTRRFFPRKSLLPLLLLLALVAAACGSAGAPEGFADQLRDFELEDGTVEQRSVTETNYRAGCEVANEAAGVTDAVEYCKCTFDVFADSVPFVVFREYDNRVAEGVENGTVTTVDDLYEEFQEAYDSVEVDEADRAEVDAFIAQARELEDASEETRALEELLSVCN